MTRLPLQLAHQKHDQGGILLDIVFKHLELTERDYFGLQLADESSDNPVSRPAFPQAYLVQEAGLFLDIMTL